MIPVLIQSAILNSKFLTPDRLMEFIRVVLILLVSIPLLKLATHLTVKVSRNKFSSQTELLIKRFVYYTGVIIILITVLNEFGFRLSALLGAAGILGIAIGFAAQTSISNIISGIFLISEKPFGIGDIVHIGETTGHVLSIDLLSIKVRTADNRFVRIPNEIMLKSEVTNITRFPTRRLNLNLQVAYQDNLEEVTAILKYIAAREPLALQDSEPLIQIEQFALSGIQIMYGVWCRQEDATNLKNALMMQVKSRFEHAGIGIPFTYSSVSSSQSGSEARK